MEKVLKKINALKPEVDALVMEIHDNPEIGHQEFKAVELQTALLERHGFEIERNVADLKTAFIASYKCKDGKVGPRVGFLAEYDALEGMGHACGHNMIAGIACCSAMALKDVVDEYGGEVLVVGAPAEETDGGKVYLANAGIYDTLDAALMAHPSYGFYKSGDMYAIQPLEFEFFGRESHAAAEPEKGINALDGVLQMFTAINALREHVKSSVRMHGIVKHGGDAANIVPGYASAQFYIRDADKHYLAEVVERVKKCAEGVAACTGTKLKISEFENGYDNVVTNETLSDRATQYLYDQGVEGPISVAISLGSSDIGNVSQRCPSIHAWFDVTGTKDIATHMQEFTACTVSEYGLKNMYIQAAALTKAGEDLFTQPEFLEAVKNEFERNVR